MKIVTQAFLVIGLFILISTSQLPGREFDDYTRIGAPYYQSIGEQKTYQVYSGQSITITVESNFTLNIVYDIYFKNSSVKSKEFWLNKVTLYAINETFPLNLFSKQFISERIRFDQIAELTVTTFYSPDMLFPMLNDSNQVIEPYNVKMVGSIRVSASNIDYNAPFLLACGLIILAILAEGFSIISSRRSAKKKYKDILRNNKFLFPFIRATFPDEMFVGLNVIFSITLFALRGDLFPSVLYTDTYAFPIEGENLIVQTLIILQSIIGIAIYGNMDREALHNYWSLPIPQNYYISASEITVILRVWFFAIVDQIVLALYTFIIVFDVPVSPMTIISTVLVHLRFSLFVISVTYLTVVLFQDTFKGLTASTTGFIMLNFFSIQNDALKKSIIKLLFASTNITNVQAILAWIIVLLMAVVVIATNTLFVRRFQLK